MKNIIITKSILFITAFILSGCDKGLDLTPSGEVSETVFWQDEKDARLAVNATYASLDGPQMVIELDGVTDLGWHAATASGTLYDISVGTVDPSNDALASIWTRYYRGIRRSNDVIINIDKIEQGDPEQLLRLEAEATFLRAYYYTQLTSLWGDVPLILEPLEINDNRGSNSKEKIVDFIITELDTIINTNTLPISYDGDNIGRATHGAALTLKARIALRNDRFEIVRDAAKAVMDLGIYELYPNYGELFQYAGQHSEEIIFAREYAIGGDTYNAFEYSASSIGGGSDVEPIHGLFEKYSYNGPINPDDPYENIDPRWDYTAYYTGQPIGNAIYNSWPSSETPDRVSSSEWATDYGYNLKKWIDYKVDATNPDTGAIDLILMRYADVLLMYAEAKIELGEIDESVYMAINQIRARVDMPPITPGKSQAELREIVRNERAVELAFEGLRLFDLRRWGIAQEVDGLVEGMYYINAVTGEWEQLSQGFEVRFTDPRDYLWPIPQAEIEINDEISQNPGY